MTHQAGASDGEPPRPSSIDRVLAVARARLDRVDARDLAAEMEAGALVVEAGAYYFRDPLASVRTEGGGQLRVSPAAVLALPPAAR